MKPNKKLANPDWDATVEDQRTKERFTIPARRIHGGSSIGRKVVQGLLKIIGLSRTTSDGFYRRVT